MKHRGGADAAFARWPTQPTAGEDWRSAAACRSADPELFFPVSDAGKSLEQVIEAKGICAGCLVPRECLSFALRTHQAYGIWGGTTEEERAIARRNRISGRHATGEQLR
jgi:WhiB family transcriptional regulator, redox-sensing transcriptional regulator